MLGKQATTTIRRLEIRHSNISSSPFIITNTQQVITSGTQEIQKKQKERYRNGASAVTRRPEGSTNPAACFLIAANGRAVRRTRQRACPRGATRGWCKPRTQTQAVLQKWRPVVAVRRCSYPAFFHPNHDSTQHCVPRMADFAFGTQIVKHFIKNMCLQPI